MNKPINCLLGAMLLILSVSAVKAKTYDAIDSYGVYVVAEKGYVKVEPYMHNQRFVDFNHLNEIPFVKRGNESLKLIVFKKDFNERSIALEVRPVQTEVDIREIKFDLKPMEKPDMYELTVASPVKDGVMLHVYTGFFDYMGAIMLGDTQKELVKYFSQKQLPGATYVKQYLDDALVAYPNNADLKELAAYWEKAANMEKDKKGYSYVEEKWRQYQGTEKLALKKRYLEDMIFEINGYLNDHPDGYKTAEAKERKAFAEQKIKEYEKLL